MDPFQALGLPRAWRIPAEQVRSAQRRVAAAGHPDRFMDPASRAEAQAQVAASNQAAAALLEPLGCGEALLRLLAPATGAAEPRPDPAFLMRMMELRERVDAEGVESVEPDLAEIEATALADADIRFRALLSGDPGAWTGAADAIGRLRAVARARGAGVP
jgi:DnaJ-domain-containing protein 1